MVGSWQDPDSGAAVWYEEFGPTYVGNKEAMKFVFILIMM